MKWGKTFAAAPGKPEHQHLFPPGGKWVEVIPESTRDVMRLRRLAEEFRRARPVRHCAEVSEKKRTTPLWVLKTVADEL